MQESAQKKTYQTRLLGASTRIGLMLGIGLSVGCGTMVPGLMDPARSAHSLPKGMTTVSAGGASGILVSSVSSGGVGGVPAGVGGSLRLEHQLGYQFSLGGEVGGGLGLAPTTSLSGNLFDNPLRNDGFFFGSLFAHINPIESLRHFAVRVGVGGGAYADTPASVASGINQYSPYGGVHLSTYYGFGNPTDPLEAYIGAGGYASMGAVSGLPNDQSLTVAWSGQGMGGLLWHITPNLQLSGSVMGGISSTSAPITGVPIVGADVRLTLMLPP